MNNTLREAAELLKKHPDVLVRGAGVFITDTLDNAPVRYWERQEFDESYNPMLRIGRTRGRWIPDPLKETHD